MMVSAVSGSGAVSGEKADGVSDEEDFASILASLAGSTTPDSSGEHARPSVAMPGASGGSPAGAGSESQTSDAQLVGVAAGAQGTLQASTGSVLSAGDNGDAVRGDPRQMVHPLHSNAPGQGLDIDGSRSPVTPGRGDETLLTPDDHSTADMDAPIIGDVGHPVIERVVADRMEAVAPGSTASTVPLTDSGLDMPLPLTSDGVSRDNGPVPGLGGFPVGAEPSPDAHPDDPSAASVEESVGSDVTGDVRPLKPAARVESTADRAALQDAHVESAAPSDLTEAVTGAETEARVESIRAVVEWLEGVGLDSTPGEMRVEIPDGDGELIVRVTVVDGRLEVDASGSEGELPERWLEDLRRELDARGFEFAGHRQGRDGQTTRRDEPETPLHTSPVRRDREIGPGVLL